ncbi:MAG: ion transporter [Dehalococcoidia bacterium]
MDLLRRDEREALSQLVDAALTGLSFLFLGVLVVEFATPLTPAQSRWVELAGWLIWAAFAIEFVVRLALAPSKTAYLRGNWIAAVAVVLPAFRVVRVFRAIRAMRSLRLARLVSGTNRGRRALARVAGAGGAGYVAALSLIIWLLAAAAMAWLERGQPAAAIGSFGDGLWWAATTITTLGSQDHPATPEGRVLGVLVMIYGLGIQGYVTATLAAFLLGRRAGARQAAPAGGAGDGEDAAGGAARPPDATPSSGRAPIQGRPARRCSATALVRAPVTRARPVRSAGRTAGPPRDRPSGPGRCQMICSSRA